MKNRNETSLKLIRGFIWIANSALKYGNCIRAL